MKHLNPRQGITTYTNIVLGRWWGNYECETPKSPPGDYNGSDDDFAFARGLGHRCETPKSPPGDYNRRATTKGSGGKDRCETPKSPPGDYNGQPAADGMPLLTVPGVKHLNPRQGITTLDCK